MIVPTVITCCGLLACSTPPKAPPQIEYNFVVENMNANGIVQTYELSGKTMVQMRNIESRHIRLLGRDGKEITFSIIGETAVIDAAPSTFTIEGVGGISRVVRRSEPLANGPMDGRTSGQGRQVAAPEADTARISNERLLTEIARIKKEIAAVKVLLATASIPGESAGSLAEKSSVSIRTGAGTFIRVKFENNSDEFKPTQEVKKLLLGRAQFAGNIEVRGFTDSAVVNPASTALARGRAMSVRSFLTRHGVSPKKITVGYEPAGNFIANNKTKEGKDVNRRVEINLS